MSEFEFLFSFFGVLLGLTVAELTVKFADAIDAHARRPIGLLTPLLALFVLIDITTFWLYCWSLRDWLHLSWSTIFTALAMAVTYFLAASLVFPRSEGTWQSLDAHYWTRKRFVLSGVLAVNLVLLGLELSRATPQWSDGWFFFYQLTYYGPLAVLLSSRKRSVDLMCLTVISASILLGAFKVLPSSRWAENVGIAFQASTSAPATRR
jgi:hypothetical protein